MAINHIHSNDEFTQAINQDLVLVDFFADWCGPCQALGPILEQVSGEVDYPIYEINIDELGDIAGQYQVVSIPTMMIFKNGEMVDKHVGVMQRDEIMTWVNSKK